MARWRSAPAPAESELYWQLLQLYCTAVRGQEGLTAWGNLPPLRSTALSQLVEISKAHD